jgi:hypothetical protein
MLLRLRTSRFTRSTEKFVASAPTSDTVAVCTLSAPIVYAPARPVRRAPTRTGTSLPPTTPI